MISEAIKKLKELKLITNDEIPVLELNQINSVIDMLPRTCYNLASEILIGTPKKRDIENFIKGASKVINILTFCKHLAVLLQIEYGESDFRGFNQKIRRGMNNPKYTYDIQKLAQKFNNEDYKKFVAFVATRGAIQAEHAPLIIKDIRRRHLISDAELVALMGLCVDKKANSLFGAIKQKLRDHSPWDD